jgi:hypothetical protein
MLDPKTTQHQQDFVGHKATRTGDRGTTKRGGAGPASIKSAERQSSRRFVSERCVVALSPLVRVVV